MATITLTVSGKAYPINYKLLVALAQNMPEGDEYSNLASELCALGIPSVSEILIRRDLISCKQYDSLWAGGNIDIRRALAHDCDFIAHLNDQQAHDLMADNDRRALKSVASLADLLYPDARTGQGDRLSGETADTLIKFIRDHEDPEVRRSLAENADAPAKFLPPLKDSLNHDSARFSLRNMTRDDLPLLATAYRNALKNIAFRIEEISDKSLKVDVGKYIAAHTDPQVRLLLAENLNTPLDVLLILLKDGEPDVVSTARKTISELK